MPYFETRGLNYSCPKSAKPPEFDNQISQSTLQDSPCPITRQFLRERKSKFGANQPQPILGARRVDKLLKLFTSEKHILHVDDRNTKRLLVQPQCHVD